MSAISQLSLPAPSAGLQLPVGRGPGAFSSDLDLRTTEQPRGPSDYTPYFDSSVGQSRAGRVIGDHGHESNMNAGEGAQPFGDQPFLPRSLAAARSIEQLSNTVMVKADSQYSRKELLLDSYLIHLCLLNSIAYGQSTGLEQWSASNSEWPTRLAPVLPKHDSRITKGISPFIPR